MKTLVIKFCLNRAPLFSISGQLSKLFTFCLIFTIAVVGLSSFNAFADYDKDLAQQLNADSYGMKKYVMALLYKGPNRPKTKEQANLLQRQHMQTIVDLAEQGKLVVAGPFLDDGELRGIYIFNVTTIEQARQLTASDPAIAYGSLKMELHPWYGSAALMEVNRIHQLIAKDKI
ncbi:YciI family protein [Shewanella waksmanii]|uniref:YciI family protein n=1 Tax=Shewanella waksmanii TaxID=213783 RepID=UPI0037363376